MTQSFHPSECDTSQQATIAAGKLYIVATPIGHLSDVTFRALEVLKSVDCILAEDTRHSLKLLNHYQIRAKLVAFHLHNESGKTSGIIKQLISGQSMALISDAGTPLISDPGYPLVAAARTQGIDVIPIPGACAVTCALSVSGLPVNDFRFIGFLPAKQQARSKVLSALSHDASTLVFYEAPHRLIDCVQACLETFGPQRRASLAHDLTKIHESVMTQTLSEQVAFLQHEFVTGPRTVKGEWVIIIEGHRVESQASEIPQPAQDLLKVLAVHLPPKLCAQIVSQHYQLNKKSCYQWLVFASL